MFWWDLRPGAGGWVGMRHNLKTLDLLITKDMIKSHQGSGYIKYNKKIINILPTVKSAYSLEFECDVKCGSSFLKMFKEALKVTWMKISPRFLVWSFKNLSFSALRTQCYMSIFTIKHFTVFNSQLKTASKMIKPEIQPVSQFFYFCSTFGL